MGALALDEDAEDAEDSDAEEAVADDDAAGDDADPEHAASMQAMASDATTITANLNRVPMMTPFRPLFQCAYYSTGNPDESLGQDRRRLALSGDR